MRGLLDDQFLLIFFPLRAFSKTVLNMNKAAATSKKEIAKLAERLSKPRADDKDNCFSKGEIEQLISYFNLLCSNGKPEAIYKMNRQLFKDFLGRDMHITDDLMQDNIFRVLDKDNDNHISQEEFIKGLELLLGKCDNQHRRKYIFDLYDLNSDGFISRDEVYNLLKNCMTKSAGEEDPEEATKELIDLAFRLLDKDLDSKISFADFCKSADEDSLVEELLGTCIPDDKCIWCFLQKITAPPEF